MLIAKEAGWPLWARMVAELVFWSALPIALPLVVWWAMREATREVEMAAQEQIQRGA